MKILIINGPNLNLLGSRAPQIYGTESFGYTHTSVSIRDCVEAIQTPVIEVHISNITAREEYRHTSLISPVAIGCIFGFGLESYRLALHHFESNKR